MRTHTIAYGSRAFVGRKCPVCKLVCKPGQTVITEGARFCAHRKCLVQYVGDSYQEVSSDGYVRTAAQREQEQQAEFNAYRQLLIQRYQGDRPSSE